MTPSPAQRHCGDCSLCCKVMAITELAKPKDEWCPHIVKKAGCGIYETRPASCRGFECLWLNDARIPEVWKPARAKFVMVSNNDTELVVHVDPAAPGAWRTEPYLSGLRSFAQRGMTQGFVVTIFERGQCTVLLPDRELALGVLAADDRIVSGHVATAAGTRFEVKVMKADEAARLREKVGRFRGVQPG